MITRDEIDKLIEESGGKEWRSYREFREYIDENYRNEEFKIVGWTSPETRRKWFKDGIRDIPVKNDILETEDMWVLMRGNTYWFVSLFSKEPWYPGVGYR